MNEKKKILIVSNFFYPAITPRAFRTTELAKEFARKGHDVTVYIPKNNYEYTDFEKTHNVIIKDIGKPSLPNLVINYNWLTSVITRGLNKALEVLIQYPNIELIRKIPKAVKKEDSCDLLLSIASPHSVHWGCAVALKNNNRLAKVWVADCGDPFMGVPKTTYPRMFYFKYIEKWFCKKVDYISVPIEEAHIGYYSEFRHKIKTIPQGYDFDGLHLYKGKLRHSVPTFAYAGNFIHKIRDPKPFLTYLSSLNKEFKFIIYTDSTSFLNSFKTRLGNKLVINKKIPRDKLIYELSQMDFLVNFDNKSNVQKPSKLIDYALTQRPILNVNSFQIDYQTIADFMEGDYQKQFVLNNLEKYSISNVANQFLELS